MSLIKYKIDGNEELEKALEELNIDLAKLVALTSVWANPKVFDSLKEKNEFAVWYLNIRRFKSKKGEKKGEKINGVLLDDNSYANTAIKAATGIGRKGIKNYHACHVYANSCYDEKYHTCIANLVLIPAPLAGLTDHHPEITEILRYKAFELFNWYIGSPPSKPIKYPLLWKEPAEFSEKVRQSLKKIKGCK